MRYICNTVEELKYLEKKLNVIFGENIYYSFHKNNYLSIFYDLYSYDYCEECCENCDLDFKSVQNICNKEDTINFIEVSKVLREEKLKRILE